MNRFYINYQTLNTIRSSKTFFQFFSKLFQYKIIIYIVISGIQNGINEYVQKLIDIGQSSTLNS